MSLQYPLKHIYITQPWGVNPATYARFGYKGHNGTDYRLFDEQGHRSPTAILYAPHDGKVIEARNDANGYGLYLKIENDKEGSILAHLKSFSVNVGDTVTQGQKIGVCDNTGWSTGAHLHWGYFTKPRDRQNGYGGTINQEKLEIKKIGESMPDTVEVSKEKFEELVTKSTKYDEFVAGGYQSLDDVTTVTAKLGSDKERLADKLEDCQKNKDVESPDEPPVIEGWKVNGLEVTRGDKTWNYESVS